MINNYERKLKLSSRAEFLLKMSTDDISLRVGLERLEIEPIKVVNNIKEENPFSNPVQKKNPSKIYTQSSKCNCMVQKKKNVSIYKKKHKKLLREPVLRLSHGNSSLRNECQQSYSKDLTPTCVSLKFQADNNLCLHTLVDTCNQLSISTKKNQACLRINKSNSCVQWWKCETSNVRQSRDLTPERSSSCSQQALNPPCDITIDELASYFETLVHIPKKMSSMAEMMYI